MHSLDWSEYIDGGDMGGDVSISSTNHLVLIHSQNDYVITELSRIAHDINSTWTPDQTIKKYRALQAQLTYKIPHPAQLSGLDRFLILQDFFFAEKKFSPLASKPSLEKLLLPYTLLSRGGTQDILLLIFLSLAKSLNLTVEVLKNETTTILKLIDEGKSRLFLFEKNLHELNKQEVLDLVNSGCDCTKTLSTHELLASYLVLLKTQCLRERSLIHFYKLQTHLIHYQPFDLHHLIDRARAAYAIGDIVRAAEDLGQYVTFHSEKVTNSRYLKLLRKLRGRHF